MKKIDVMTVAILNDIVQSQLCVHGNKPLFVRGMPSEESFQLFVGDESILDCVSRDDTGEQCDLNSLAERLVGLDQAEAIISSSDDKQTQGFQIGFRSEREFIETINSKELKNITLVAEF